MAALKEVTIYSDGACQGNPGPGGWAAILQYGEHTAEISGAELATTNNRMEIRAAIEGLSKLKEPCAVQFYTDSEYVKNGITKWIFAWKRKNWKIGTRPVKNADLWKSLDSARARHAVTWHWVRGHAGHPQNERCDVLAVAEIAKLRAKVSKQALAAALKSFVAQQQASDGPGPETGPLLIADTGRAGPQ